jgi:Patatin-like phospholipase
MNTRSRRLRIGALIGLATTATTLACGTLKVDTRSVFADLTYASTRPETPTADLELQVLATLQLEATSAYRDPQRMAMCLRFLQPSLVETLGEKLEEAGTDWAKIASTIPVDGACGDADDPALVRYVIARIATAAATLARSVSIDESTRRARVYERVPEALDVIARILEKTPPRSKLTEDAPALALSGGSANGAFTAGFMFELLSLRERSLPPEGDGGKYRFSAIVGTSVGSLIAQILDLYFVDPSTPISETRRTALDNCNAYWEHKPAPTCAAAVDSKVSAGGPCFDGWPTGPGQPALDIGLSGLTPAQRADLAARRPRQMCTLTKLYQSFTDVDEQTLMCVEPGSLGAAFGIVGRKTENLIRFDPMYNNVVASVLEHFADEMLTNEATRVVVAVETQQNQYVGLDERACAGMPRSGPVGGGAEPVGSQEYCLGSAVMGSVVLPFFARPVRHTYVGVGDAGQCGTWFDGGLRSGFPAYRALRMTRPAMTPFVADPDVRLRVLAISTGRFESEVETRPSNIADVAFDAINQLSDANVLDEVVLAQQMALVREDQLFEIQHPADEKRRPRRRLPPAFDKSMKLESLTDWIGDDLSVSTVFVPAEAPEQIVAGGQYSFDRYIMRGLWVWGRYAALQRVLGLVPPKGTQPLFARLGWRDLEAKAQTFAQADEVTIRPWIDAYTKPECDAHQRDRMNAGRNRILNCMHSCSDVALGAKDVPQYLICPPGARGQ